MKKQKPQKITTRFCSSYTRQRCQTKSNFSFMMSALVVLFFLIGNGNLKAQCSITNFSATDATCGTGFNEDDSFFSVTFDVVDGSGTYILINPANNISYGTGVNEPTNGTVSFLGQASITGVTPGNTTQVMLIDAMNPCLLYTSPSPRD